MKMKKKTSIGGWAYIWGGYEEAPIELEEVLKTLKDLDFDGIEMAAFPPHLEPNTPEKAKEVKAMLDSYGLEVSGLAAPFPSPATSKESEYIEAVKTNLAVSQALGSPKLRVDSVDPPTGVPGGMDYDEYVKKVAAVWNKAAQVCADGDTKLIWEFEPGFMLNKPSEVMRMVYLVDHVNFTTLFDSCHAHMCAVVGSRQLGEKEVLPGGVVQFAHMLTGKIGHIHLIDSDETLHDDDTSTHAPLGTGILDFNKIMPAIAEAGYDDEWWPIDLCFWPEALKVTKSNKEELDKLINKFG
jgi:sugar phosphate isomerase/epimerase